MQKSILCFSRPLYPYIQGTDVRLNLMAKPQIASKPERGNLGANVRTFCFGVNPAPSVWGSHTPKMGAKRFTTIFGTKNRNSDRWQPRKPFVARLTSPKIAALFLLTYCPFQITHKFKSNCVSFKANYLYPCFLCRAQPQLKA